MPKCNGCDADIVWIQLDSRAKMPCDKEAKIVIVQYEDLPEWVRENLPSHVMKRGFVATARESHFATCPKADEFRKAKEEKNSREVDALAEDADREMIGDDVAFGLGPIGVK